MNETTPAQEVIPPAPVFTIDDDNFVDNGEAVFHISDVKSMIRTIHQQNPTVGIIIFNFLGSQVGMHFPDFETRDRVFSEVKRRLIAIKNGTINKYIANFKKELLAQSFRQTDAA